ncbi:MAG: PVC-type heme-binding CxxCH protein [Limisphaerales bacterium]
MRCLCVWILSLSFGVWAAEGPPTVAQALKLFQIEKSASIEIAAAEPQLRDPVAMCFEAKGRMLVVESPGYPFLPGNGKAVPTLGRVALLEDADGDGRFEKRTTFAEGFTFPNGILPWKGGVFVTCAPDIWYLKDSTGDGRADVRRVVLTGFGTKSSSEQLRVASPTLGPDGWVYVTSGLTDANVTSPLHPKRKPVVSKRQDGRFHPETFIYESLAGAGQFGQCFDAFGNRFVSSNRNPLMHVVIAPGLLQRNPHYSFTDTIENVIPVAARVYPLSPDTTAASYIPSLISRQHAGTYTSASGIVIRGRSAFICEPAQNLVQRQVLTPAGATYTAAHPKPSRDFLATPDQWFRPVHTTVGPDGALYLCDMVRQYIDHPRYLPEAIRGQLPFKAGTNHGRIWRVKLSTPTPPKPTAARQAAARQNLAIRQGKFPETAVKELLKQAESRDANERFLAVLQLGKQEHSHKANVLAASLMQNPRDKWMRPAVYNALSKGASMAIMDFIRSQPYRVDGTARPSLITALKELGEIVAQDCTPDQMIFFWNLGTQMAQPELKKEPLNISVWERVAFLNGLILGAKKKGVKLTATHPDAHPLRNLIPLKSKLTPAEIKAQSDRNELPMDVVADFTIKSTLSAARNSVVAGISLPRRLAAIELMGNTDYGFAGETLLRLLRPRNDQTDIGLRTPDVQSAAVQALGKLNDARVSPILLDPKAWASYHPLVRESVLSMVASRALHHPPLMDTLEKGTVPVHAITPARRKVLERSKTVGDRAKKLFAQHAGGDRMKAFEAAKPVLKLNGTVANGAKVFTRACATCHTHGGQGHAVGPDLTGLRNQPAEALLLHIIVPNKEVYGQYAMYEVDTQDDETFAGLLAADTPGQITLKLPLGLTKTIPRKSIKTIRTAAKSLMPDQLEQAMSQQELADLLAFLKK